MSLAAVARVAPRVLSIQSHVVHGCVGNRAAVLPLQLLGVETDVLNTVQFSNTPDHGSFAGEKLTGEQLWALIDGMYGNGLLSPSHLLTGYMGSVGAVHAVLRALPLLQSSRSDFEFWCDPVLGDHGRLYVAPELVERGCMAMNAGAHEVGVSADVFSLGALTYAVLKGKSPLGRPTSLREYESAINNLAGMDVSGLDPAAVEFSYPS